METLERILKEHAFFKGLDPAHIELITGCSSNVRFDAGHHIFHEGEEANQFYLIRQGRVALEIMMPQKGAITIETIGEGDILGWSWLLPPYQWHFDAKAQDVVRAIALDGKCLRGKCEQDTKLGYELMKRFAHIMEQRLESTRIQLLDLYGDRP
ncbi:MAG: cyclic nucleotide-binding domain-containing protein [bacterium]